MLRDRRFLHYFNAARVTLSRGFSLWESDSIDNWMTSMAIIDKVSKMLLTHLRYSYTLRKEGLLEESRLLRVLAQRVPSCLINASIAARLHLWSRNI